MRFSLMAKILGVVGTLSFCSLVVGMIGVWSLSYINDETEMVTDTFLPLSRSGEMIAENQKQQASSLTKLFIDLHNKPSLARASHGATQAAIERSLFNIDLHFEQSEIMLKEAEANLFFGDSIPTLRQHSLNLKKQFATYRKALNVALGNFHMKSDGQLIASIDQLLMRNDQISKKMHDYKVKLMNFLIRATEQIEKDEAKAIDLMIGFSAVFFICGLIIASYLSYYSLIKPIVAIRKYLLTKKTDGFEAALEKNSHDEIGELARACVIYKKRLTKQKMIEDEIKETNQRFINAINQIPDGFVVYDKNDQLVIINEAFKKYYAPIMDVVKPGITYENLIRASLDAGMWDIGDLTPDEWMDSQLAGRKEGVYQFETEGKLADGRIMLRRESRNDMGEIIGFRVDVTEERKKQQELENYRDHLEETVAARTKIIEEQSQQLEKALEHEKKVNEVQKQFIYMASHEFRTPLAIIDSSAQRMFRRKDRLSCEDIEKRVGIIRDAVKRMSNLMENTLSQAKANADRPDLCIAPTDLKGVIEQVANRQRELSPFHTIEVDLDIPDRVNVDGDAMDQVFTNLLSNAVKYSPDDPLIKIEGKQVEDRLKIVVIDHGIGIDHDDLPSMFQQFFRAKTATKISGTGIGLNIVKQIVEDHGGCVEVTSEVAVGSHFYIEIPLLAAVDGVETSSCSSVSAEQIAGVA